MNDNIFLCGFMGSGKTLIGKTLSKMISYRFIDLDEYIETYNNETITEMFKTKGESYFRKTETNLLIKITDTISKETGTIVSLGGGAVISEANVRIIKESGKLIFIDTDFDVCFSRINKSNNRPLANKKTYNELLTLFKKRYKLYLNSSTFSVNGNKNEVEIAKSIIEAIK